MRILVEGKTKIILSTPNHLQVVCRAKPIVTWGNSKSAELTHKDVWATTTTASIFRMLKQHGRQTSFIELTSPNEFTAWELKMIKIEAVCRFDNEGKGSFAKRNPDVPVGELKEPVVELFLKSKDKVFNEVLLPDDDPLITRVDPDGVWVHHPARRITGIGTFVPFDARDWHDHCVDQRLLLNQLQRELLTDATLIRNGWRSLGWRMGDIKLEYGMIRFPNDKWRMVLGDVADNDSWRLKDPEGNERSKQNVRDRDSVEGADIDYRMVAEASYALAS